MKRILLTIAVLCSSGMADALLLMKQGWQLVGSAQAITDMSQFKADDVEQVWHFDAQSQKWLGYSPDPQIQQRMEEHNISKLSTLQNWHGFWIKSKHNWGLKIDNSYPSQTPNNPDYANDVIQLKAGWNLISLPVDTIVSPDIFQGMTVWKYDNNQEWELFDSQEPNFPRLGHINNAEGIWVKAPQDINISTMSEVAKLHNFTTFEAMEDRIKEMATLYVRPYYGVIPIVDNMDYDEVYTTTEPMALPTAVEDSSTNESIQTENSTGTNLQEAAVDEADIVKHNGVNIFYTSNNTQQVNITTFQALSQGQTTAINHITLNNGVVDSLYLLDNTLVVLSRTYDNYQPMLEGEEDAIYYITGSTHIDTFNIEDINHITKRSGHTIDGNMISSRLIGERLYLISTFNPQFNIQYPKNYITLSNTCESYFNGEVNHDDFYYYSACYDIEKEDETGRYFRYDYEHPIVTVEDLLPEIEGDNLPKTSLVTPEHLYASAKQKQTSTITSISAIDLKEGSYLNTISYIGSSYTQYASAQALYLVSNDYPLYYDYYNYRNRSIIYKFNLDESLNYQGIGTVYGNPVNQFALSEQNDILRIATTDGFSWTSEGTHNTLYTLKEQNGLLPIQGVLDGLGEEGETIRAVRFMGDKGYIVTARTSDPLYTLDLSDPLHPQKVGELHISGFSSYLHPVGEDKLLGIGQETDEYGQRMGLKIELFDVSDFANPTSLDTINYAPNTYSELEENHKALAYRTSDQLFAFPYRAYGDYTTDYRDNNYLGIYQVRDNELIRYRAMRNSNDGWGEHRGLIFDLNNSTYVSFFSPQSVITQELNQSNIVN